METKEEEEFSNCRLCNYRANTYILSEIFQSSYEKKIEKHLYLKVSQGDELSKYICIHCSQHLDSFHGYFEKINTIQRKLLKAKYEEFSILSQIVQKLIDPPAIIITLEDNANKALSTSPNHSPEITSTPEINKLKEKTFEIIRRSSRRNATKKQIRASEEAFEDLKNEAEIIQTDALEEFKAEYAEDIEFEIIEEQKYVEVVNDDLHDDTSDQSEDSNPQGVISFDKHTSDRDSDTEEWPAAQTLGKFPKKIIQDGLLLIKGKKLMQMICKFYKLECQECEEKIRFRQIKSLFEHYLIQHKSEGYLSCCSTKLTRMPAIINHMCRHIQPDAFKCNICGYFVTRPRFLESHRKTHLPENERPYGCDKCPRKYSWKNALQIHLISHQNPSDRRKYICPTCGKFYENPGSLSTHKKIAHSIKKAEAIICHICPKNFATRTGLAEHLLSHSDREKTQLQCPVPECQKWLMNKRCLKSHMLLHSDKEYHCQLCEYATKKPILLKRHLLTQHSDKRDHVCSICHKGFKLKRALTVHMTQQHSSTVKTYKCSFCDRVFANSTNFYTHRKNLHPKELQKLNDNKEEEKRLKRVRAGIEAAAQEDAQIEEFQTSYKVDEEGKLIEALIIPHLSDNNSTFVNSVDGAFLEASGPTTMVFNVTEDGTFVHSIN